jgi:hypothetical protein
VPIQNNAASIKVLEENTQFSLRNIRHEIQALKHRLENSEQLAKAQHEHIKNLTEAKLMSKCGCQNDSKDASDYIVNNNNSVEFIKTFDGRYIKAKDIRSYRIFVPQISTEIVVLAEVLNDNYTIEKFDNKADAESFLEDLIENYVSE